MLMAVSHRKNVCTAAEYLDSVFFETIVCLNFNPFRACFLAILPAAPTIRSARALLMFGTISSLNGALFAFPELTAWCIGRVLTW